MLLAHDRKNQTPITLDSSPAHCIFITGKRGSGKSYTLGRLIEQLYDAGQHLIVVIDPLSVFWTTAIPINGAQPIPVRLLVPGDPATILGDTYPALAAHGLTIRRLALNPARLPPTAWLDLLGLGMAEPQGAVLFRAVHTLCRRTRGGVPSLSGGGPGEGWSLADLAASVQDDDQASANTTAALLNRLSVLAETEVFQPGAALLDTLDPAAVNVVDLAGHEPGPQSIRNLVVKLLVEELFRARTHAHRAEQLNPLSLAGRGEGSGGLPPVFLLLDEAHDFCPAAGSALAKPALTRYAKEGRSASLSLALATQQPGALDAALLSQADFLVIHRLTNLDDIKAIGRLATSYASDLVAWLKGVRQPGQAIIVDDTAESVRIGHIAERRAQHGGAETAPLSPGGRPPAGGRWAGGEGRSP